MARKPHVGWIGSRLSEWCCPQSDSQTDSLELGFIGGTRSSGRGERQPSLRGVLATVTESDSPSVRQLDRLTRDRGDRRHEVHRRRRLVAVSPRAAAVRQAPSATTAAAAVAVAAVPPPVATATCTT